MNTALLLPVFALAAWTGCVLVLVAVRRIGAGLTEGIRPCEYAMGESGLVPARVALANRNYMNLLELPVLFYVACIVGHVSAAASPLAVVLAWAYVVLRVVHSLIHLSFNHVMARFAAFATSNVVLVALWVAVGQTVLAATATPEAGWFKTGP